MLYSLLVLCILCYCGLIWISEFFAVSLDGFSAENITRGIAGNDNAVSLPMNANEALEKCNQLCHSVSIVSPSQ